MPSAPRQPDWRLHAPTGKKYQIFQLNGRIGYQFEDGSELTEHEFNQLTHHQSTQTAPRSIPGVRRTQESHSTPVSHTNSGQAETDELLRTPNQSELVEPAFGSPPRRNYVATHRGGSGLPDPQCHDPAFTTGTKLHISDRNSNRYVEQNFVPSGQPTTQDYRSAENVPQSRLSQLSADFVGISVDSYASLHAFVLSNPAILSHVEIDNLISEAGAQERAGNQRYAQIFVHHALLLRNCRGLDSGEYAKFFKRLEYEHSDVRQKLIDQVETVYATLQRQARTAVPQSHLPSSQNRNRSVPLVGQPGTPINRNDATQPLPNQELSNSLQSEAQHRHEVAVGDGASLEPPRSRYRVKRDDGRWEYEDEKGRSLQPATSRDNSGRHRRDNDGADMSGKMAKLSVGSPSHKDRVRNKMPIRAEDSSCTPESTSRSQRAPTLDRRISVSSAGRMPTLSEGAAHLGREFNGTGRDLGTLDSRMYFAASQNDSNVTGYYMRDDAQSFFTRGRVFALVWHEPAGQSNTYMSQPVARSRGRFGEEIHSHILRMVVILEQHGACWCLPIHTYGGRGVSKSGLSKADRKAHTIIHMSDTTPRKLPEETDMNKKPIAVDKASPEQKLDEMSRINFSRVHTVIWNVKVMDVGTVSRESIPSLVAYWKQVLE